MSNHMTMKIKILMLMSVMLFIMTGVAAQPSMDKQRYRIDYVEESHLLRKGNMVTVLTVKFEWPIRLSDYPTTALQTTLSRLFFGKSDQHVEEGMAHFLKDLGKEIQQMPDETGLEKRYINLKLFAMGWEKDKYISLLTSRTYRKGDNTTPDSICNELLTYDIVADNVLRMEDIIKKYWRTTRDPRNSLAQSIMQNISHDKTYNLGVMDYYDYMDALPDEACLMPEGVLFTVPGKKDTDGLFALSLVPDKMMIPVLKPSAQKTLTGENERRKDPPPTSIPMINDSIPKDSLYIYDYTSTMPEYNGKTRDMMAFLYRQIDYPQYEKMQGIQGKVVVSFVVERDGSVTSPSVISPVSPGIDRQAVKAIMAMPKWKPGINNGVPVRVRMRIPITFKLQEGEITVELSE